MGTALQPLGTGGTCGLSQLLLIQARMEPTPVEGLAPQGRGGSGCSRGTASPAALCLRQPARPRVSISTSLMHL